MTLSVAGQEIWRRFARALDRADWIEDPRSATPPARSENRDALGAEIEAITRDRATVEWIEILSEAGVPAGEINDIGQVFANPQVAHLGLAQPVVSQERGETRLVGQPILMSRTPSRIATPLPTAGQHCEEILSEIGYDAEAVAAMKAQATI